MIDRREFVTMLVGIPFLGLFRRRREEREKEPVRGNREKKPEKSPTPAEKPKEDEGRPRRRWRRVEVKVARGKDK